MTAHDYSKKYRGRNRSGARGKWVSMHNVSTEFRQRIWVKKISN